MLYTVHVHKPGDILYIVQYITWFMYMYSISPGLCTVYHLVYVHVQYILYVYVVQCISPGYTCIHVQYITCFTYMYSISSGVVYTCT